MSSIWNSRTRLLTAAATVALASLSLTACSNGTGTKDEGASAGSSTSAAPSATATASADSSTSVAPSERDSSSADAKPDGTTPEANAPAPSAETLAASGKTVTCAGSNTKTVAAPLTRPVNHMLLTVTNTGSKSCYLYSYPAVSFGEAQSVPPVIEDSRPQAVVTLKPGQSGYASVNLSATDGSGSDGRTAKSLTVFFHGRSGNASVGTGAHPGLPAKGVYVDDSLKVTYWQQSMDDALNW
jgi:hypothetical protein